MSSSDKTKQKLMETMRMSKADPGKKIGATDTKQTKMSQDEITIKDKEKNATPKKAVKGSEKLPADPYQTVRRVWPD